MCVEGVEGSGGDEGASTGIVGDGEVAVRGSEPVVGGVDKNGKGERASVATRNGEKTTRRGKEARTSEPVPIRLIAQNSVR